MLSIEEVAALLQGQRTKRRGAAKKRRCPPEVQDFTATRAVRASRKAEIRIMVDADSAPLSHYDDERGPAGLCKGPVLRASKADRPI